MFKKIEINKKAGPYFSNVEIDKDVLMEILNYGARLNPDWYNNRN